MIINRLKFEIARAKAQLSLQTLSKRAKCNPRHFYGDGEIKVPSLTAGRIASALNVDLESLIDDD